MNKIYYILLLLLGTYLSSQVLPIEAYQKTIIKNKKDTLIDNVNYTPLYINDNNVNTYLRYNGTSLFIYYLDWNDNWHEVRMLSPCKDFTKSTEFIFTQTHKVQLEKKNNNLFEIINLFDRSDIIEYTTIEILQINKMLITIKINFIDSYGFNDFAILTVWNPERDYRKNQKLLDEYVKKGKYINENIDINNCN